MVYRNGYEKLCKNFVSFIRNNYDDFDDSPTFAKVNNELVDHTSKKISSHNKFEQSSCRSFEY